MTIYYVDPEGGLDTNDGLSFATRWQTFKKAYFTGTAGDTVRVIASPDPNSVGNATWTDASSTVTLAAPVTATVENCDTAWTASTNVTCTTQTGAPIMQGTAYARAAVASAFTTGKIAYKTLAAPLDLSAFQQISFWYRTSLALAPTCLELRLCTDTLGATAVHTIPLPGPGAASNTGTGWAVAVKDFGGALNSAIQSIALYANSDPGTPNIDLDNIIAAKAPGAANCLTHVSLIGKNTVGEPEWYPIRSIDSTTVVLGTAAAAMASARTYRGTTETVATYARTPLIGFNAIDPTNTTAGGSGTGLAPSQRWTWSGGWDRTAMASQTGETWMTGFHWVSNVMTFSGEWAKVEKLGACHATGGGINSSSAGQDISLAGVAGCGRPVSINTSNGGALINLGNAVFCTDGDLYAGTTVSTLNHRLSARRITGTTQSGLSLQTSPLNPIQLDIGKIDNCGGYGLTTSSGNLILKNTTFANNTNTGSITLTGSTAAGLWAQNCTLPNEPTLTTSTPGRIYLHGFNGNPNDHRIISRSFKFLTDSAVAGAPAGTLPWKATALDSAGSPPCTEAAPAELSLAKVAVKAGSLVTVTAKVRRDNTGLNLGIKVQGGFLAGVADVQAGAAGAANAWETLTLTFTPTAAGVVEILGYAWAASTTYSGWWNELNVTQA